MRPRTNKLFLITVFLICLTAFPALAGSGGDFGIRGGIYTDRDDGFLGAEYNAPLSRQVFINPNVEYVFVDRGTFMTFNFDGHYDFPTRSSVYVWAGGGLGMLYWNPEGPGESNTDLGVNLLFGLGFKTAGSVVPYIQAKAILADNNDFVLGFGLRF